MTKYNSPNFYNFHALEQGKLNQIMISKRERVLSLQDSRIQVNRYRSYRRKGLSAKFEGL